MILLSLYNKFIVWWKSLHFRSNLANFADFWFYVITEEGCCICLWKTGNLNESYLEHNGDNMLCAMQNNNVLVYLGVSGEKLYRNPEVLGTFIYWAYLTTYLLHGHWLLIKWNIYICCRYEIEKWICVSSNQTDNSSK